MVDLSSHDPRMMQHDATDQCLLTFGFVCTAITCHWRKKKLLFICSIVAGSIMSARSQINPPTLQYNSCCSSTSQHASHVCDAEELAGHDEFAS